MRRSAPFRQAAWLPVLLTTVLACGDAATSREAPPAAPADDPATWYRPPPDGTPLDEAIVLIARDAIAATAAASAPGDDIGVDDETPRLDAEREPPEGCVWAFLHSAGAHVSVQGLDSVSITLDDDAFELTLRYGDDMMVVRDEGRSAASASTFEELRRVAAADWADSWPGVARQAREWATDAGFDAVAIDTALTTAQAEQATAAAAFADGAESLHTLYRAALRAPSKRPPRDLVGAYREHALLRVRRRLAAAATEPPGAPLRPIASGPCEGVVRGDPSTADGSVMLSGADDVIVRVVVRRGGAGGLGESAVDQTLHSFRPYAPSPEDIALIGDAGGPAGGVLVAMSRFHLQPRLANATAFLEAYAAQSPAPEAAERAALARALAAHHGFDGEDAAALERTATGE